ncbi:protein kinase [Leptolyngbya sp. 'hensonii']|uniref:YybH family protein n=1 Tax=Leptolyngbya sp. 'hensonii' TaxID=1922337 RepID=UPI00094FB2EA|nr:nuclear transport factor 2 family protein [Leptolyngbya sp. 'hensonii']OLP16324.1 protein kinase [Leptolyngbya sp. 'hensonii']
MKKQWQTIGYRAIQLWVSLLILLAMVNGGQPALADARQQDHEAIIQTREIALKALNTRNFSQIEPYLHPTFTITTVDNHIFSNIREFEQYWTQQLAGPIKSIEMTVKVDAPTTFLSQETGVAHGDARATFSFADGNLATMAMRWTAVMQKFQNKWTIQSLHFSANLLDNPVLAAAQRSGWILAIAGGIGGLLVGVVGGMLLRRRTPRSAA